MTLDVGYQSTHPSLTNCGASTLSTRRTRNPEQPSQGRHPTGTDSTCSSAVSKRPSWGKRLSNSSLLFAPEGDVYSRRLPGLELARSLLAEAQLYLSIHPLMAFAPGLAISLAILGFNLLGDGLRDVLDPSLARE